MSRAFTREDDGSAPEALPDLPQSPHPNHVTPAGLAALKARLAEARARLAALQGRRDEIEARLPVAMAERDIRYLDERLRRAIPSTPPPSLPASSPSAPRSRSWTRAAPAMSGASSARTRPTRGRG